MPRLPSVIASQNLVGPGVQNLGIALQCPRLDFASDDALAISRFTLLLMSRANSMTPYGQRVFTWLHTCLLIVAGLAKRIKRAPRYFVWVIVVCPPKR